jgi:proline racemase
MHVQRSFSVIDSHTAGHPTRVVRSGIPPLEGTTVKEQRDYFQTHYDDLRGLLLHEPRGHAAMVAAVPVPSRTADYGVFFISSYIYLDMCGHGTIGFAKTLAATGELEAGRPRFSLETPAGQVDVELAWDNAGEVASVTLTNVASYLGTRDVTLSLPDGRSLKADLAYGGVWYAVVDAAEAGLTIAPDRVGEAMRLGESVKSAYRSLAATRPDLPQVEPSVLFVAEDGPSESQHLVVLANNKFDRSPCGTGTSARLAQLHARGRLAVGQQYRAKSVLGTSFDAVIESVDHDGAVTPRISGTAHLTAFSTIVCEGSDPLAQGFLCT